MKSPLWPLRITVAIAPQGKERPRFGKGRVYTPSKTKSYEELFKWHAMIAMKGRQLLTGPVRMTITAAFRSSGPLDWHTKKPDASNIQKAIEDAFNGIVFSDDCVVASTIFNKIKWMEDLVDVMIEPITDPPADLPLPKTSHA